MERAGGGNQMGRNLTSSLSQMMRVPARGHSNIDSTHSSGDVVRMAL